MQLYITLVDRCKDWYHVPLDKARVQMRSHVLYAFFVWQHHDWIWPSHPSHFLCLAGRWHDQPVLVPKPWEGLKLIEDAGGRCIAKIQVTWQNRWFFSLQMKILGCLKSKLCLHKFQYHIGDHGDTSLQCPIIIPTLADELHIYVAAGKDRYSILASLWKDWSYQWKVGWL